MSELQLDPRMLTRTRVWILIAIVVLVVAAVLWLVMAPPDTSRYQPALAALEQGKLTPSPNGRIDLSHTFPHLTPQDEMFTTRRPDGSFLALFPDFYAKGPAIAGMLYTSRPLTDQDIYLRSTGVGFNRPLIACGPWHRLSLDHKINDHWYHVSYGI